MSRILIVEDENSIAEGLRFNLEAEGHQATVVPDGEGALGMLLADRQPFDAVILDVMLPGKDGFAVASELRSVGQFVPILMLTARGSAGDVLRGFEAGADDYLPSRSTCLFSWRASTASCGAAAGTSRNRPSRIPADCRARPLYICRPHDRFRGDGARADKGSID